MNLEVITIIFDIYDHYQVYFEPTFVCSAAKERYHRGSPFGSAGQGPKMDPRRVTRLVGRTAVGEGERGWVSKGERR